MTSLPGLGRHFLVQSVPLLGFKSVAARADELTHFVTRRLDFMSKRGVNYSPLMKGPGCFHRHSSSPENIGDYDPCALLLPSFVSV